MPMPFSRAFGRVRRWLRPKALADQGAYTTVSTMEAGRTRRQPTAVELMSELKNTVFTCASINAAACAAFPPRLYVATFERQAPPKCATRALPYPVEKRLRARTSLPSRHKQALQLAEVVDHPLLTLLKQINPVHNSVRSLGNDHVSSGNRRLGLLAAARFRLAWNSPSHLAAARPVRHTPSRSPQQTSRRLL